ncbi:fungal-specific transcription factor domain-containing protein [Dichomitus squalens]|uniref:Fungal-specific transcription factor domain-containing protein n=1 Tax=Dichomitus squalens TaxID=114155 RepID=A0A4Q9MGG7_9APHY|nr:fungal-specific transcription factor domain-containing protein [Dichomitus squalens]
MPCSSFRRATHPTLPASVLFPRGFHPTTGTDSSDDIDPSDDDGHAVTDVNFKGYHGKSSGSDLVRTILNLKSTHTGAPLIDLERPLQDITKPFTPNTLALASNIFPAYKENVYPPRDLMHELIDAYFNRLNIYLALLHRPTFERDVKNGLHLRDRGFGAVLLLVCAIGSGLLLDSSHIQSHGPPPGYHWFELVSTTDFSLLARPRLYDLQACALIAAYINMASSPQGCGVMLSLGIRMAQDVGAHRKKMYSATPTPEQELWKRAFWVLVAMDRIASFALGRPSTINDEDFDLDPMTECDDEYWSHPDPSQAFKQPPGKPSKVAFCNAFIRLLKIQASASRTIFTLNKSKLLLGYVGPEWKQRIVAELDSSMNKWLYTVPPHLRWDPNREDILFFYQSAILYTSYYQLQICIHRPFIPSPRRRVDNPPLPSMTICVNAARACVRVLHAQHKRMMAASGITSYTFTPFEMPLFTVGTMLGVYLWCGARDAQATLEDMDICFNILKDFEEHVGARKLRAVLEVMVPSASRSPGEGPRTAPGSNLAKEGAQTIDEILTVAMKSLRISPHTTSSSDSSGTPSTPASADPALSSEMNTLRSNSCSDPTDINPEQAASLNELAYNLFSGCDMWALESNTINTPFTQDRPPSPFFSAGTDGDGTGPSFAPLAGHRPSLAPTQTDPTLAIPAGAPSLTSVDLGFLDSLSSMFDSMQYAPPTSSTHVPAPSTSENAASSHPLDACAPTEASTFASLVADPPAWLRDGDQDQDAGLWQWCTAPDGELWSQWEAYIHDQGGVQDPDFLAS